MLIELSKMADEKNRLIKIMHDIQDFSGTLKQETSVINPVVTIEAENLSGFNYMYIPSFGRYYFITDIVSVRKNLWRVSGHVDVLTSFSQEISNIQFIVSDTEINHGDNYLPSNVWKTNVKTKTDIINFTSGLNNTGEYILITSGG